MSEWWSIEVLDGPGFVVGTWWGAYQDPLIAAALTHGATDWTWHQHSWGGVLEIEFADEAPWEAFRESPAVRAALDAIPDPASCLLVHRGRGGSAGTRKPRRPKPRAGGGVQELPTGQDTGPTVIGNDLIGRPAS